MGPWMVTELDYRRLTTITRLESEEYVRSVTGGMSHEVETRITGITRCCTMYSGDIIWMGTGGNPRNIKPGDVVEIGITGIGELRSPVVAER